MNMKTVIPLGLAIVLGLVAAIMVRNTIAHRSNTSPVNSNTVAVVVARTDIDPGRSLTKDDLVVAKVPAEVAPGHVFSDPNQLVGRVVISPLAKGQTVMETLLASVGSGSGLQALIPPGMRAYTIQVDEFSSVGGMLEPGCRVDLLSTMNDPKTHEAMCRTVLQNVKITAIGRNTTTPHPVEGQPLPPPSNSVTFLLTLKQAQTLDLACMSGRPWMVLRSYRDSVEQQVEAATVAQLRNDPVDGNDTPGQVQNTSTTTNPPPTFLQTSDNTVETQPTTIRRTVTYIRNGVEQQVTYTLPAPSQTVGIDPATLPGQP
jgi:pilus assembly protein CpaB